ncbi:MAG: hypothetical protein ABSF91_13940 [Bacteroidota bacterium]
MKIRVICLSKALRVHEALSFARNFKGQIEAKFVYSRIDDAERWPDKIPRYYVVRIPLTQERRIKAHDMMVEEGEVLDRIPIEKRESMRYNDRRIQAVPEPEGDMTNDSVADNPSV